ncbi:3'(2'),5'-bisphosphate nucleotidase CysQ [Microvirga brassicacearum]|uniref:3'(2'),5'-bisphosphate nucleotidase CysQ n=1 Tax=Microvirga brassicacearum TaxID=2580413 RepID=A0A5N3P7G7_9HYPH|nr:3'(2'),5'-bisphosphate nucleotidase CysQ [Microvirga brassicacearum]KAB0265615.1 3'(2'),5'-bisphosphate nucleotidase CysQ [Microvirga brassicacearum]
MLAFQPDLDPGLIHAVRDAARRAGDMAKPYFRAGRETAARVWFKEGSSPVTEADIAVDTFLKEHLSALLPDAAWLSEETADDPVRLESRRVWIVDPIDGTRAFAAGHPDWSVSIGLVQDGRPVLGIVHAPIHNRLYEATPGGGAFCNGEMLSITGNDEPFRVAGPRPLIERFERRHGPAIHLPKVPSLALRLVRVADGSIDLGLVSAKSADWDIAAADLILREAGGVLTDLAGEPVAYNQPHPKHGEMVAAGAWLHPRVIEAMRA